MDQTPHILVVDDHNDIRTLLSRYLVKNGLRVSTADDAAEARRLLCLGFAGEILDRCGITPLGEHVRTAVADRLAQAPTGAEGV